MTLADILVAGWAFLAFLGAEQRLTEPGNKKTRRALRGRLMLADPNEYR